MKAHYVFLASLFPVLAIAGNGTMGGMGGMGGSHMQHMGGMGGMMMQQPPARTSDDSNIGHPGNARDVDRTIEIDMQDSMRFIPDKVTVHAGETVKFVIHNSGNIPHEMVIGTQVMASHMQLLDPGKQGELIWQFTSPGDFSFGCYLPGHYQAGMHGSITVEKAESGNS